MHNSVGNSINSEDIRDLLDSRGDLVILVSWLKKLNSDFSSSVGSVDNVLSDSKFISSEFRGTLNKVSMGDKSNITINMNTKINLDDITSLEIWELEERKK